MKCVYALLMALVLSPTLSAADDSLLAAGPMLGHVDLVEVKIWLQTKAEADVALRYWPVAQPDSKRTTPVQRTKSQDYLTTIFVVTDLLENTEYAYEVLIAGKPVPRPYPTRFKTQKFWQWRTDPPDVRIAFGSCLYVNDPYYDRPGTPYGSEPKILAKIVEAKPDALFWLGDNLYLRESDFFSPTRMAYRYRHDRAIPELQPLLAACANYAIWDDHDYGPNDSGRSYPLKNTSLDLFTKYWANPTWGMPDTPGVFGLVSFADADFFLTDNRYYRAPEDQDEDDAAYYGPGQMQWLKDNLLLSKAPFKFILSGSQVVNTFTPWEAMPHHEKEHRELLEYIRMHHITGVVILSGDRHHSELFKANREGTYPLYEFTASSFSAGLSKITKSEEGSPIRVEGTLVQDKHSFGVLDLSGPRNHRVLTMKVIDVDGTERWSISVKEEELR